MKFRVERELLSEALSGGARVASNRNNAMPALSGVHFEVKSDVLVLTSTDNDLSVRFALAVAGLQDGVAVVSAKLISDIVRAMPEEKVTIEAQEDEITVSAGSSEFKIHLFAASDFPNIVTAGTQSVTISAKVFAESLNQVVRAASSDMQRLALTGVLMVAEPDSVCLVATDSYRLAVRELPGATMLGHGAEIVVPGRALDELKRLIGEAETLTMALGENRATFEVGNATLTTTLLNVEFPKYKQLISASYPNKATTAREAFLEAVRRLRILARETTPVRLEMLKDSIRLSVVTQDLGQGVEELEAKLEGSEITVGFNSQYLLDGIDAISGDEITIESTDPVKPAVLRGVGDKNYLYLVMPQRLTT
jgi:DNA polymerase III subunit beta